ncbi:MAG: ester cyclase [Acidobacteria bacterium]|nr:ester cyclase [Acidobacteriota bacterium]
MQSIRGQALIRRLPVLLWAAAALLPAATDHQATARRFYEQGWFGGKAGIVDEVFAAEFLNHELRDPDLKARAEGRKLSRQAQKDLIRQQSAGARGRIDMQVSDGDRVVTRWRLIRPLTGWWERLVAARPAVEVVVVDILRFDAEGRIAEVWTHRDDQGVEEQMRLTGLYYFEGAVFGALLAWLVPRMLRRKTLWPGPPPGV